MSRASPLLWLVILLGFISGRGRRRASPGPLPPMPGPVPPIPHDQLHVTPTNTGASNLDWELDRLNAIATALPSAPGVTSAQVHAAALSILAHWVLATDDGKAEWNWNAGALRPLTTAEKFFVVGGDVAIPNQPAGAQLAGGYQSAEDFAYGYLAALAGWTDSKNVKHAGKYPAAWKALLEEPAGGTWFVALTHAGYGGPNDVASYTATRARLASSFQAFTTTASGKGAPTPSGLTPGGLQIARTYDVPTANIAPAEVELLNRAAVRIAPGLTPAGITYALADAAYDVSTATPAQVKLLNEGAIAYASADTNYAAKQAAWKKAWADPKKRAAMCWSLTGSMQSGKVLQAVKAGLPDQNDPSACADFCKQWDVLPCFLWPHWKWGLAIPEPLSLDTDPTTLRAVVGLGANDNVTWECHVDTGTLSADWTWHHVQGLTFDQVAASVISWTVSAVFQMVTSVLEPFAEVIDPTGQLKGALDQGNAFIQQSISQSEAQYQAAADT